MTAQFPAHVIREAFEQAERASMLNWKGLSEANSGSGVFIALFNVQDHGYVAIRKEDEPGGLHFMTRGAWDGFVAATKAGRFDDIDDIVEGS